MTAVSPGGLRRWLAPSFALLLFLVHPLVVLLRPERQLQDPGTGWHLATGRYILATGTIPHHDLFSFTASGQPWMQPYWLFETGAALLERLGGLPLYAAVCILLYACLPVLLYRRMLRLGVLIPVALLLTMIAYVVLTSHALARPHVVTYLAFAVFLERLDDVFAGRRPTRALWPLVPMTALWVNLHGGFLAGVTLIGIYAAAAVPSALTHGAAAERRRATALLVVLLATAAATLVNPSGIELPRSLVHHLGMATTGAFAEFQSPAFHSGSWPIRAFLALLLATLVVAARAPRRLTAVEGMLLVFFLHMALHAVRHMNLFAIVAAPLVARALSDAGVARWPAAAERWRAVAAAQRDLRSHRLYAPAACAAVLVLAVTGRTGLPTSLDGLQLTRGAAEFVAAHRERFTRPFNTDNLGGALIARFWPDLHVYVDDRIYVYGDDFVANDYLTVLYARPGWQDALARQDVDSAIVNADTACATVLRTSPEWEVAFEDGRILILFRRTTT